MDRGETGRVSQLPGCIPAKLPNKSGRICNLEATSSYIPSKMGGALPEISELVAGNAHEMIRGRGSVSKTMVSVESRSPRVVGQGRDVGAGATENSAYSPIDGMVAFGNAEFSATIPDQSPWAGKLSIIPSHSPKSKSTLHPAIP